MTDLAQDIRELLRAHQIALNTNLGQHFLLSADVLDAIVNAAAIAPTDHVLEIGTGVGALTRELVQRAGTVTAIELDRRWLPLLREFIGADTLPAGKFTLIEGNALDIRFPDEPYKIVANIPYHITSPLLRHAFLESPRAPQSLTLLIQFEVAEKIADDHDRGILTIVVGLFGKATLIRKVPPSAFLPPPKVDSAVLHIACYPEPLANPADIERVMKLLKIGFGQKRKMLSNTLGKLPDGMQLLEKNGIDPTRRPQTLSVEEWLTLARTLPTEL